MTTAPQKIAIRRLVRGEDGQTRSILVDAYSYVPVTDPTGYQVVDVGDVPEQVKDVNNPDAEKPVAPKVDRTTTNSIQRGGSEFGGSSRGNQTLGKTPSTSSPSRAHVNQFPSASAAPTQSTPSTSPSPTGVGSSMPSTQDSSSTGISTTTGSPVSTPSSNPPGYSQPSQGATPQNYSPATPNAAAAAAGNSYYTGDSKTYDFSNPNTSPATPAPTGGLAAGVPSGTNVSVNNGVTATTSSNSGIGTGATSAGTADFGGSFGSGNNNGRGTGIASTPSPSSTYGGMYGAAGFGGGFTPDTSNDSTAARTTVDAAKSTQSASERSQAMGSVPDSATSPAAAAARGLVDRTPAQLDRIGLTIAGEVTPQTLADLSSPDPAAQAAAKAQVANIQATMENRAATAPWGTIENALTPSQYNSLTPGKQLNVSTKNYQAYNAALSQTVKDFYTGLNPPTNYNFTNYANTNPIPGVYAPPGWLNTIQDPTVVGPFTFGTDPAYSNPSRMTPEAQANYSAAAADYGAIGAYKTSPDYGTAPGWGTFADPTNPNGYSYGMGYGQSAVDPGWGGFAGATDNTPGSSGGYTSNSGNNNGRGTGIGGFGGGGATSYGGGSGYGGGGSYGGSGTAAGGSAGMSGGGGYSPGGMGSPSGSSAGGGGFGGFGGTSAGSDGNNSGTSTGGGAGTNGSGGSKGAQGRSDGDY